MRSIGVPLTLIAFAASSARADGPIAIIADVGISTPIKSRPLTCYADHDSENRPALNLDIAYRFIDQLAAGVHVGAREYPWEDCGGNIPGHYQMYRGTIMALELGVVAQWSLSRFWLATWLGIQDGELYGGSGLAYALGAGVDAYVHPSGHRVGVYLDLTNAERFTDNELFLSAGVAYRYW